MSNLVNKELTIITVAYNSMGELPEFIDNLIESLDGNQCEIIVVDNNSNDGVESFIVERQTEYKTIKYIRLRINVGYGEGLNIGIRNAKTRYVALMNPDIRVEKGGFLRLLEFIEGKRDAAGVSGALFHVKEFSINKRGAKRPKEIPVNYGSISLFSRFIYYSSLSSKFKRLHGFGLWRNQRIEEYTEVSKLNGSFGVFRKAVLEQVGLFDPRLFLYFEEEDLARRIRKNGYRLYLSPLATIYHKHSTGSKESQSELMDKVLLNSQYIYFNKYYGLKRTWIAFIVIWCTLTAVMIFEKIFKKDRDKNTYKLWKWHFDSCLRGGRTPDGTLPVDSPEWYNYNWCIRYETEI